MTFVSKRLIYIRHVHNTSFTTDCCFQPRCRKKKVYKVVQCCEIMNAEYSKGEAFAVKGRYTSTNWSQVVFETRYFFSYCYIYFLRFNITFCIKYHNSIMPREICNNITNTIWKYYIIPTARTVSKQQQGCLLRNSQSAVHTQFRMISLPYLIGLSAMRCGRFGDFFAWIFLITYCARW